MQEKNKTILPNEMKPACLVYISKRQKEGWDWTYFHKVG